MKGWNLFFESIKNKYYSKKIKQFLDDEYKNYNVFPERKDIFKAFELIEPSKIKVVIIGQDPYCKKDQATGLAFSVSQKSKIPPSLQNIFKEIEREYHCSMKKNGDLTYLARRGCLLLNTVLTVRENQPLSHDIEEYRYFMKDVLDYIDTLEQYIVFLFWGNKAKKYLKYVKNKKRLCLFSCHPSPLSASCGNWFGNNHFILANKFLLEHNLREVNWQNE